VRVRKAAALAIAGLCLAGTPASAVDTFGPAHRVTVDDCFNARVTANAKGAIHGFVECRTSTGSTGVYDVHAAPGQTPWARHRVFARGHLLAEADDGSASYAVVAKPDDMGTVLVKRSHGGTTTTKQLSGRSAYAATIKARAGRWWAVWSANTAPGSGCLYLFEGKTIGTDQHNVALNRCGTDPSLALGSGSHASLAWRRGFLQAGGDIKVTRGTDGHWGTDHKLNGSNPGLEPSLIREGTRTVVAWMSATANNAYNVLVAIKNGTAAWQHKRFTRVVGWAASTLIAQRGALVCRSGTGFAVAWTALGSNSKGVIHIAEHHGSWTTRDIDDQTTGDSILADLTTTGSRLFVVMTHDNEPNRWTVLRHQ
jgi:hypothetical protein